MEENHQELKRGLWSLEEDSRLKRCIEMFGTGNWKQLPRLAGLRRDGCSCRFRWYNYLRPDLKRGMLTYQEAVLIIRLQKILGNKWSKIVKHLPGRTDNEIKNFWNSGVCKKIVAAYENNQLAAAPQSAPGLPDPSATYLVNNQEHKDMFNPTPTTVQPHIHPQTCAPVESTFNWLAASPNASLPPLPTSFSPQIPPYNSFGPDPDFMSYSQPSDLVSNQNRFLNQNDSFAFGSLGNPTSTDPAMLLDPVSSFLIDTEMSGFRNPLNFVGNGFGGVQSNDEDVDISGNPLLSTGTADYSSLPSSLTNDDFNFLMSVMASSDSSNPSILPSSSSSFPFPPPPASCNPFLMPPNWIDDHQQP